MAITTKEQALNEMKPDGGLTLQYVINYFVNKNILTEEEVKEELKKSYPNVTDWGF